MLKLDLRAFRYLLLGRFWVELWRHLNDDDCWGMAAQLSYYFLLGFFPFLIFLSALIGYIPWSPDLVNDILLGMRDFLPDNAYRLVREIVVDLLYSERREVLLSGIVIALWSASMAFNGMIGVFNRAYQVKDTRRYLRTRLLAVGVTITVSIFLVLAGVLLFFGDWLVALLTGFSPEPLREHLRRVYSFSRWFFSLFMLNVGIQIVYYALPARRLQWRLISPGSVFSSITWVMVSQGFSLYVNQLADYRTLYGGLGAIVVLMIWFYLSSLFLLVGGEIDSGIYRLRREQGRIEF